MIVTLSEYYFSRKSTVRVGPSPYDLVVPLQKIVQGITSSASGPAFADEGWNEGQEQQACHYQAKTTNGEKTFDHGEDPLMNLSVCVQKTADQAANDQASTFPSRIPMKYSSLVSSSRFHSLHRHLSSNDLPGTLGLYQLNVPKRLLPSASAN